MLGSPLRRETSRKERTRRGRGTRREWGGGTGSALGNHANDTLSSIFLPRVPVVVNYAVSNPSLFLVPLDLWRLPGTQTCDLTSVCVPDIRLHRVRVTCVPVFGIPRL